MGLFDNFFGGGESETKTKPINMFTPEQRKMFDEMIQQAYQGIQGPAPSYPGELSIHQTPEQQAYFDWARSDAVKKVSQGQPLYEVGPEFAQQYFEEAIRPMYEHEWETTIQPGIRESYAGPTYHGSARAEAERKAATEMGLQMAAQKGGLTYGEELARRQAIESAMGMMPQMSQAMAGPAQMSREMEEDRTMADLSRWLSGEEVQGVYNPMYNPALMMAYNLLGVSPWQLGQQGKSQGPGLGYGVITGLAGGTGDALGAKLFA